MANMDSDFGKARTDTKGQPAVSNKKESEYAVTFDTIYNLTPHNVMVVDDNNRIIIQWEACKNPASVDGGRYMRQYAHTEFDDLPLVARCFGRVIGVPPQRPGVGLIVSSMVASALPERQDLIVSDSGRDALRDDSGNIIAVRRLLLHNIKLFNQKPEA